MNGPRRRQGRSPLAVLAGICIAVLVGGLVIGVALGGMLPLPYGPADAVSRYIRCQPVAMRVMAVAVFGSSVPLAIYAATASALLRQLGAAAAGATIALTGGILASGGMALTGLLGWVLSRPEISADPALVQALYYLAFLAGGPAHIVALGLLIAGMAVPGLSSALLPRSLARSGLVIAGLSELATLVLIWPVLGVLLPVARVCGLLWLVAAGANLGLPRNGIRRS